MLSACFHKIKLRHSYLNTIRSHKEERTCYSHCSGVMCSVFVCFSQCDYWHCCDVSVVLRATPVRWPVMTNKCLSSFVRKGSRMCWRLCLLRRAQESAPTSKSKSFFEVPPHLHTIQCMSSTKSLHIYWNMFYFQTESEFGWWGGSTFWQVQQKDALLPDCHSQWILPAGLRLQSHQRPRFQQGAQC